MSSKEYKVLSQADSFWKDRFSPEMLEGALNNLASNGWRVVTCATTEFTGLGGIGTARHQLFVLLERDVDPSRPADAVICDQCGAVGTVIASGFCSKCKKKQLR